MARRWAQAVVATLALGGGGCLIPAPLNSQDPTLTRPVIRSGVPDFNAGRFFARRSGATDGGLLGYETQVQFSVSVFYPDSTVPQLYPAFYRQKLDGSFVALTTGGSLVQLDRADPHTYTPATTISFPLCSLPEVYQTDFDWLVYVYVADGGPWPLNLGAGQRPEDVARGNFDSKYWTVNCQ